MAANSKIEWTTHTFNPWRGCTKVSAGCANCYAETLSGRNPKTLGVWGPQGTRVVASESMWREPLKWEHNAWWCETCNSPCFEHFGNCRGCGSKCRRPVGNERPRVFCASLADIFEDWAGPIADSRGLLGHVYLSDGKWGFGPDSVSSGYSETSNTRMLTMHDVRTRLFALIDATPNLDWLLLTKRPENIARMVPEDSFNACVTGDCPHDNRNSCRPFRPNLWLGASCENQQAADERIPHLLRVPAAVRFLSCEPLLGPVDLTKLWLPDRSGHWNCLTGKLTVRVKLDAGGEAWAETEDSITGRIHWVIVGGESSPGARPCNVDWIRDIVGQCKAAGVPVFVKQFGSNVVDHCDEFTPQATGWPESTEPVADWDTGDIRLRDKKGGDPAEWPADLRVREFPAVGR